MPGCLPSAQPTPPVTSHPGQCRLACAPRQYNLVQTAQPWRFCSNERVCGAKCWDAGEQGRHHDSARDRQTGHTGHTPYARQTSHYGQPGDAQACGAAARSPPSSLALNHEPCLCGAAPGWSIAAVVGNGLPILHELLRRTRVSAPDKGMAVLQLWQEMWGGSPVFLANNPRQVYLRDPTNKP